MVIDVAHNPPGVAASVATWRELWGDEPVAESIRRAGADAVECASGREAIERALDRVEAGGARGVLCLWSFHVAQSAYRMFAP